MNHVTVSSSPVKVTLRYGQKGERGIGISSVALDDQAHLIITYDDGKTQDAGAALGDVTSIKDGIDSTYKKIQASEANVTKLEASTKTNAEKAQQALQDTQSASTSGVNTINTLVTEKMTYMTSTFNSLLTQAKANIDQWERDAEDKIHKVRTYSLEQIKTAHDDAMVDIERSVNKAEAWAVSETSPDRDTDMESPTGLTMSSKSWALYSKNKVTEAIDSMHELNKLIVRADAIKTDIDNTYQKVLQSEINASGFADKAKESELNAKNSETMAGTYKENVAADAKKVQADVIEVRNIAKSLKDQIDLLHNPVKELVGVDVGILRVSYFDGSSKDITLAQMGADTSAQVTAKVNEGVSTSKLYTDRRISELIGGAPDALDTLKELADALGNDANIAANITKKVGDIEKNVANEIQARKDADTNITSNVQTQVDRLQASDQALSDRIDTEVQNRQTGDQETYTKSTEYTDGMVGNNNSTIIKYVDNALANAATNDDIDLIFAEKD